MASHRKISVSLPDSIYFAINTELNRTGKSRSALVAEALRARFEPEATGDVMQPGLVDSPTRDEHEALEARVKEIEQTIERAGG